MTHIATADQEKPVGLTVMDGATALRSTTRPPVFLHCGWRTRGTWIWNRFRALPGVTAYYEPLAETIGDLRPGTLASITAQSWPSGHRGVNRPYYDEYRSLLKPYRAGVPGYRTSFAAEDFFAAPDAALPDLRRYLRGLLRLAQENGRQPILKFCRSVGRIAWMQREFPEAVHIVVLRDPFTQFASALRHYARHGNGYFLVMPLLQLARNRALPVIGDCVQDP